MAISESFAHIQLLTLGVQATPGTGMTSVVIQDIRLFHTNTGPQRTGVIQLLIDGATTYDLRFTLTEEEIDARTIQGYSKRGNPNVVTGR